MIPQVPFFALQKQFKQHGPDFVGQLQAKYGDVFTAKPPLLPHIYFVVDAQLSYELLVKQSPPLAKPKLIRRATQSSFGNGLFTSEGDFWRSQRKLMQPVFRHGRIGRFAERMVYHTAQWLAERPDGEVIEIDTEMHALTFTIVVDALFSTAAGPATAAATGADTAVVAQAMHDLGEGLNAQSKSILLTILPDWTPLPALRQKQRGSQNLACLVQAMIAERRSLGEANSPPDLLSMLLFTRDAETGEQMSDQQIQDELVTLFIAGHETTAVLLAWIWMLLSKHPAVLVRLHEELDRVLHGRLPTLADLPQLPTVEGIVKETLRLYPPAWFLFRELAEPMTLTVGTLTAGSILFLFPYAVQRDGRYFDDPTAFRPERWQGDFERSLPKGAYFPFGMGPRICIGNGFASMEAQLLLATIAQRFHLQAIDEAEIVSGATTLGFAKHVRARMNKR
jgi:cytochrome P450